MNCLQFTAQYICTRRAEEWQGKRKGVNGVVSKKWKKKGVVVLFELVNGVERSIGVTNGEMGSG